MITTIIHDEVVYNTDNPEKQLVVKECFTKTVKLFGVTIRKVEKGIDQSFEKEESKRLGFK